MKTLSATQINQKFQGLVNGSTHEGSDGIVGTNNELRNEIWNEFRSVFDQYVSIRIEDEIFKLKANHSVSGKSTHYCSQISKDAFVKITGSDFGLKKKVEPLITIQNGKVEVHGGGNFYVAIDNNRVEIVNGIE